MRFSRMLYRYAWVTMLAVVWSGCATSPVAPPVAEKTTEAPVVTPPTTHELRHMIVVVPLTEDSIPGWLKLISRTPSLRMVLAVSPRFKSLIGDSPLKEQLIALQKSGRLELALQLPNAPFLPLLIDTNAALNTLAPGSRLPSPAFSYPDDVIQIVARAKAEFYHSWHALPRGIVLPYGAASPALFQLFDHLGFSWIVAALHAPAVDGPYSVRSLTLWDAAPVAGVGSTRVIIWDERLSNGSSAAFMQAWTADKSWNEGTAILPSDPGLVATALPPDTDWKRGTWTTPDWTPWIGSDEKNAAWGALRATRDALERYKNSGQASVERLDMAFEEIFTAENSSFFLSLGNDSYSPAQSEEREHEFQATLTGVYRIMGQTPPDDLFSSQASAAAGVNVSSGVPVAETLSDGRDHLLFPDPSGDARGDGRLPLPAGMKDPAPFDLQKFEVFSSTLSVDFVITLGAPANTWNNIAPLIDIYIDQNGQPNAGTQPFLPGRVVSAAPADQWEYALSLTNDRATLYRTQDEANFSMTEVFPVNVDGARLTVSIPRSVLRGSPRRWGYQVLVMAKDPASPDTDARPLVPPNTGPSTPPIYDLLDPSDATQADLLHDVEAGRRNDIPFVRILH